MAIEHLQEILRAFNKKLKGDCPEINNALAKLEEFKQKPTKGRKKRLLHALSGAITRVHEMQKGNDEHFDKEGLDDLVDSLVRQSEEFENQLPPDDIKNIMKNVVDVAKPSLAYTNLTAFSYKEGGRRSLFSRKGLVRIFREGILGNPLSEMHKSKKDWVQSVKENKDVMAVHFNIVGRGIHYEEVTRRTGTGKLFELRKYEPNLEIFLSDYVSGRPGTSSFVMLFDLKGFKEEDPIFAYFNKDVQSNLKLKRRTYRAIFNKKESEVSTELAIEKYGEDFKDRWPSPDSEYGFVLSSRLAPRHFKGIMIVEERASMYKINSDKVKAEFDLVFSAMRESGVFLPIYQLDGRLLWPQKMSYEEVKKFVKSK